MFLITGMAPRQETDNMVVEPIPSLKKTKHPKREIVWTNVVLMLALHAAAVYGVYLLPQVKLLTWVWVVFLYMSSGFGITGGAHRLWAHRSYKATAPMRFLLMIFNCVAGQNHIFEWVRDHRVHHKHSETDADPHNAKRGFFFSHVGWLLMRKHPDVISKGQKIPLDDLYADKIVMFQKRYVERLMKIYNGILSQTAARYFASCSRIFPSPAKLGWIITG